MSHNKLTKIIELSQERIEDDARNYIGASSIGSDCLRQIWYQYKGVKAQSVPPKVRRTWDIGKRLEELVIQWVLYAGMVVERTNVTYHAINVPIFQGHLDGLIIIGKKKSILEIKTAKDASFTIFVKKGLKSWNPQYYSQIQSYMGMSGIESAFVLVLNKDNSELYDEFVEFDPDHYESLEQKAIMIANAVVSPPRVNGSPLWYQCKICKFSKVCHG